MRAVSKILLLSTREEEEHAFLDVVVSADRGRERGSHFLKVVPLCGDFAEVCDVGVVVVGLQDLFRHAPNTSTTAVSVSLCALY